MENNKIKELKEEIELLDDDFLLGWIAWREGSFEIWRMEKED